jgi:hypothetical protein
MLASIRVWSTAGGLLVAVTVTIILHPVKVSNDRHRENKVVKIAGIFILVVLTGLDEHFSVIRKLWTSPDRLTVAKSPAVQSQVLRNGIIGFSRLKHDLRTYLALARLGEAPTQELSLMTKPGKILWLIECI